MASDPLGSHGTCQVVRYAPGESVPTSKSAIEFSAQNPIALPGDFILTHSSGTFARLIRFGQRIRYHRRADRVFAHWSHSAIFINEAGDIIEALGGGVQQRNISAYHGTDRIFS
jgi:uncharacterized protein YycO